MAAPIKEYSLGKCKAAIFENEYQGKKSYSVKFQKSYTDKGGNWKNTDFFSQPDLRDLYGLIGSMLHKQVKERIPKQSSQEEFSDADVPEDIPY